MNTRRDFLKKVSYVAPAVISLKAVPSFANTGSSRTQAGTTFIDMGGPCEHETFGLGDGETIKNRVSICR